MSKPPRSLLLALGTARAQEGPDHRTSVFDVSVEERENGLVVTGVVSDGRLLSLVSDVAADHDIPVAIDVDVLEAGAAERTVTTPVASVRDRPDSDAEQVTQTLYGATVTAFDRDGDWTRVRVPDGYVGWVRSDRLGAPTAIEPDAVVSASVEPEDGPERLYAGSPCRLLGDAGPATVEFRTGETVTVPPSAVRKPPAAPSGEEIVAVAEQFVGTSYDWGGMTADGIDCSGLVWIACRVNGLPAPRDADQQRELGRPVDRSALAPGDLLFFPGHVAISTGGDEYLHAYGTPGEVVYSSFDPDRDDYESELDENFACARRIV